MAASKQTFRLSGIAAALALAGCATGMSPMPALAPNADAVAMPALAQSTSAVIKPGVSMDRWWTLLDDAHLNRLMDEALERNEDLESAVARVREARSNLDGARAAQSPTVDAQINNGRQQQSTVAATPLPPGVDRRASSHKAALAAGYELDLWGRLSSATEAARQQLLASEWARASIEWSITSSVAETYFGLAATDRQIEISEAVRAGRAATLQLRNREYAAGAGSEFDVRRAEAELTATEASLASLARQRAAYERTLALLLGRTPAQIATGTLSRFRLDERKALEIVLPEGSASDLLVRRPDIRQAEAQLAAANASIEAARAATLPSLRLSGSLGSDAKSISDLFSGPAFIWSIAASAAQPLIDGGKLRAQVRAEHARAEQMLADYRKAVAAAVGELREAYEVLDITHQGLRAAHERVASLARATELARLGYEHGAYNFLDLLDAERNLYQAQLDQVSAYRDQLVGQVSAFKALGGGYAGAPAQNTQHISLNKP